MVRYWADNYVPVRDVANEYDNFVKTISNISNLTTPLVEKKSQFLLLQFECDVTGNVVIFTSSFSTASA